MKKFSIKELGKFRYYMEAGMFYSTVDVYVSRDLEVLVHGLYYDVNLICSSCGQNLKYIEEMLMCEHCGEVIDQPSTRDLKFTQTGNYAGYTFK